MATVKRTLSTKSTPTGIVEIHLRISVSRGCIIRIKSGLYVDRKRFNDGKFIMPRDPAEKKQLRELEDKLELMEKFLIRLCEDTPQEKLNKDFVLNQLELFLNPPVEDAPVAPEVTFFDIFEDYITKKNISEWRIKHLRVLKRALMRYELYVRANGNRRYKIKLDDFTVDDVNDFEKFLRNEHKFYKKYPKIYEAVPADTHSQRKKPKPHPKGDNTIVGLFGLMRAFYRWCRDQELTTNDPFAKYNGTTGQ